MTSATCRTSRPGFTLVELLLAITLMGLVVGLAVPRIGAVRSTYFAAESAKTVANALRSARIGAIRDRTTVALVPAQDGGNVLEDRRLPRSPWGAEGPVRQGADQPAEQAVWSAPVVRTIALTGEFEIHGPGEGILFYPDGSSSGGQIIVRGQDGSEQHHFLIESLTGEVFIQ